jgi:L-lactate dehydrogenase complex protein LldG
MSAPSTSRQRILDRVRVSTHASADPGYDPRSAYAALPRSFISHGELTAEARIHLMIERLREYGAEVVECSPEEVPATIAAQLAASGKHVFVAPSGIPPAWMVTAAWQISGLEWNLDQWDTGHGLTTAEIEKAEGVVTAAFCGVANSGTIAIHHSLTEGRRVLTLLPDWHLCILHAGQVVETLPEYFGRCHVPPSLVTWISGPSATADIEMTRIKGVHGPRFLHVILVRDPV